MPRLSVHLHCRSGATLPTPSTTCHLPLYDTQHSLLSNYFGATHTISLHLHYTGIRAARFTSELLTCLFVSAAGHCRKTSTYLYTPRLITRILFAHTFSVIYLYLLLAHSLSLSASLPLSLQFPLWTLHLFSLLHGAALFSLHTFLSHLHLLSLIWVDYLSLCCNMFHTVRLSLSPATFTHTFDSMTHQLLHTQVTSVAIWHLSRHSVSLRHGPRHFMAMGHVTHLSVGDISLHIYRSVAHLWVGLQSPIVTTHRFLFTSLPSRWRLATCVALSGGHLSVVDL